MKALKLPLFGLIGLVALIFAALVTAMLVIDPNNYKKLAEDAALEHTGLTLSVGDIGWQFFPSIGLNINDVKLVDSELNEQLATLIQAEQASVALAVMPLLRQEIQVEEFTLNAPVIQHITAADGSTNWDRLTQTSAPTENTDTAAKDTATLPEFAIAAIQITDASLRLADLGQNTSTQVDRFNLSLTDVALDKAIPLNFSVSVVQDTSLDVTVSAQGNITVNSTLKQFTLAPFELSADIAKAPGLQGAQRLKISANARADLTQDIAAVSALTLSLNDLQLSAQASIKQLTQNPTLKSHLELATFSPRDWLPAVLGVELPPMAQDSSLSAVSLSAAIEGTLTGDAPSLAIKPLTLTVDKSILTGEAAVNLATQAITAQLNLDQMNLDHYLPPPVAETETSEETVDQTAATSSTTTDTTETSEPLIPVATLRPLNADVRFTAQQLVVKAMAITDLTLEVKADAGLITLNTLSANTLGGNISTTGSLDVRADTPKIRFDHATQTLKLHPVVMAFLGKDVADGTVSLSANLATQGNTVEQWLQALVGNSEFRLDDGALKGLNLTEMAYNQLNAWGPLISSFVPEDYAQRVPPAFQKDTGIKNLLAKLEFKDGKIHTKDLAAQVQGSDINGTGEMDIATLSGDMRLSLKLSESLSNPTLSQLTWPIVCSFSATAVPSCDLKSKPVRREIEKLAKRALKEKGKAALEKKLAEKLRLDEAQAADEAAKAKIRAEEEAAKAKLRAEEEAAKAKLREEEERAKDKVRDAFKKLF